MSVCVNLVASFLWMFATSYNIGYMRSLKEHAQTRYYFCFAVAIFGAMGVAFSGNVFTLYLFYEVISVFTYPLVAHHEDEESFSGQEVQGYLMGSSKLFLLPALVLTYVLAGSWTSGWRHGHGRVPGRRQPRLVQLTSLAVSVRPGQGGHLPPAQLAALGHGRPPRPSRPCCTPWPWSRPASSP